MIATESTVCAREKSAPASSYHLVYFYLWSLLVILFLVPQHSKIIHIDQFLKYEIRKYGCQKALSFWANEQKEENIVNI